MAAFMLNLRTLFWNETVENVRHGPPKPPSWRTIASGDVPLERELARVHA